MIDNVPFNLWNLRSFTDKDRVGGSPAHLASKLCSSSLGDLGSTDKKGGKHWGPICFSLFSIVKVVPSAKERLSFMSKSFFFFLSFYEDE